VFAALDALVVAFRPSVYQAWAVDQSHRFDRWLYRDNRPNGVARIMNRAMAGLARTGLAPRRLARLDVAGRRTGRTISFPVVVADYERERYLVAMLGESSWVQNVRAANGHAVLAHGKSEPVVLEELARADADRGSILRRYLECAPGARPHIPVDRNAPPEELSAVAAGIPIFRITMSPASSAGLA
jgi:hypothetical protein